MKISSRLKGKIDEVLSDPTLAPRLGKKRTRYFIDNEFLENGYAAAFPKSVGLVYNALARCAHNRTQVCFPGIEKLMALSGVRNRNSVEKATVILERVGIIRVSRSQGRWPNIYVLLDTAVWKSITNDITNYTVLREAIVSKRLLKQYQIERKNDITGDTRSHINKSTKEINKSDRLKKVEIRERQQELSVKGRAILRKARKELEPKIGRSKGAKVE